MNNLKTLLPCAMPGQPYGLEQAQQQMAQEMTCPGEFAFGCIVPFEVEVAVAPGGTAVHEVKPITRLLPVAMVSHLSGPDIRIDKITRRDNREAGLTGDGITTTRDPANFDWESLKTPFNPFPPDVGPVDSSRGFQIHLSHQDAAGAAQLFQGTFFGLIGGHAGLKYLREHFGLSGVLDERLSRWLASAGIKDASDGAQG